MAAAYFGPQVTPPVLLSTAAGLSRALSTGAEVQECLVVSGRTPALC